MSYWSLKGGETIGQVHEPTKCYPHPCCVHNPSDHHMAGWRQHWRSDAAKMERICPHGIGHPDPDHVAYLLRIGAGSWTDLVHGCDGCCQPNGPQP